MSLPHKRRRRPLPSADAIAGNDDLMTEILIRLPAKSLCRFKSVSKRWYSLISHPHFSQLRMPKSVSGFFLGLDSISSYKYFHLAGKRTRSAPFKYLSFVHDPLGIDIMHSCNGLLLCYSEHLEMRKNNYYIYNPTTKQFAIIPLPPPWFVDKPIVLAMNLAFDPSRSPHYKIVVVCFRASLSYQIEIYSSETGAWRPSGDPFTATPCQGFSNGVFLNGTIHWFSIKSETSLRFDVDRECLETMPMPPLQGGKNKRIIGYFGASRGHLHLICGHISTHFDVLELESDYSKWFVKYCVDLDALPTAIPEMLLYPEFYIFSALHLVRGEREEESFLVLHVPCMAISYNFKDKTLRKLCNLEIRCRAEHGWLDVHPYVETLVRI